MRFYKICGRLTKGVEIPKSEDNAAERKLATRYATQTVEFNKKTPDRSYILCEIKDDSVTACLIARDNGAPLRSAEAFSTFLGLEATDFTFEETTLYGARNLLNSAEEAEYIESESDVLKKFALDRISNRYNFHLEFGENLTAEKTRKSDVITSAKTYLMDETLLPEINRIYAGGKNAKVKGHPVHYVFETNDRDVRREVYKLVLNALYANKRLDIRRYTFTDLEQDAIYSEETFDALYKLSDGGAMVIRYVAAENAGNVDAVAEQRKTIDNLCRVINNHKNKVLTILCFPRGYESVKEYFFERLSGISFIEVKEDPINGDKLTSFMNNLAKEYRVKPDKTLFDAVNSEKSYTAAELTSIFNDWCTEKLRSSVYPQYSNVKTAKVELAKAKPKGSAYEELTEMVGLTEVKQIISKALNYYKMLKLYKEHGIKTDKPAMHMCFSGNPGTAKTTVARLFAEIMRDNGLISSGQLVEVGRGELVGKYVGWTAQTVTDKFREAMGGVLFIDEAYSLVDDRDGSYGDEAISVIVQEMENHREDVVVIFAGYPDKMEEFLKRNPGMRSRIAFHVPFTDYSPEELCDIAKLINKKSGMRFDSNALEKLKTVFSEARSESDFGNGRYVRNLLEQAKMNQASRLLEKDFGDITAEEVSTITADDITVPQTNKPAAPRIGFC